MSGVRGGTRRRSVWGQATATGLVVGILVGTVVGTGAAIVPADAAAAASAELTSSAVTVTNADALNPVGAPFPKLEVTVSQTKNLVSQGIEVSWTGAEPSERPSETSGGSNFLQIMQCWGDDPEREGRPDRRTCQYGGTLGAGSYRDGSTEIADVAPEDAKYTHFSESFFSPTYTGIPFVASNTELIVDEALAPADRVLNNLKYDDVQKKIVQKRGADFVDLNTNPFFTRLTTNEVKWAGSGSNGTGSVPFEIQTGMQSTALGCGTPLVQPDQTVVGQPCWLVIIPRGTGDSGSPLITRSGLWWDAWEHHIAVKLDFRPLGVRCEIGEAERQLAGSELIARAVASWQPSLCLGDNGSPFVLSTGSEEDAAIAASGTDPSPLAFTSSPLNRELSGHTQDPLVYAPVALSGVAISFSIDRQPHPQTASPENKAKAGLPFTDLKLTPRLVAKLLTSSYVDSLPNGADKKHIGYNNFEDAGKNPRTILQDQEFRDINDPEWSEQIIVSASVSDALVPSGRSDLAVRLWSYVMADAAARDWLDGKPDEHGMIVNPWYSTNPDINPTKTGLALPMDSFPKADPTEKPDTTETDPGNGTGAINLVTWRPYTESFGDGAYHVLRADGMILGGWDRIASPPKFGSAVRELFGSQKVIGLTTAPAAELYQTVTAALRNPAGEYVTPTETSILAAAAAMTPITSEPRLVNYDFSGSRAQAAPTSYPLAMPVYAAVNPLQTDEALRAAYADLIRFAATDGQKPGTELGQLPPGYAPLPKGWADQALVAADAIEKGISPIRNQPSGSLGGGSPDLGTQFGQDTSSPSTESGPSASGDSAGALTGNATPDDPELGPAASAIPAGLLSGLAAAAAVPLMTRIRRKH